MKILEKNLSKLDFVIFPEVYEYSSNFIIESYIEGNHFDNIDKEQQIEFKTNLALIFLKMLYVDHFIHCDLHFGNIIWTKDNQLGLIDFGLCETFVSADVYYIQNVFTYFLTDQFQNMIQLSEQYNKKSYCKNTINNIKGKYEQLKQRKTTNLQIFSNLDLFLELFQESEFQISTGIMNALTTLMLFQNDDSHDYIRLCVHSIIADWDIVKYFGYKMLPIINLVLEVERMAKKK